MAEKKKNEKNAIILSFIGIVLAAIIGAVAAVLSPVINTFLQRTPAPNLGSLKISHIDFNDWQISSVYALPLNSSTGTLEPSISWDTVYTKVKEIGFQVLYKDSDFTSIRANLPENENPKGQTLDFARPYPIIPLELEVWNLEKETQIIIDNITINLISFENPPISGLNFLYFLGPAIGGGNNISKEFYNLSLTRTNKYVSATKAQGIRIFFEPRSMKLLVVNITFLDPGRFTIDCSVDYHLSTGEKGTIVTDKIVYSWIAIPKIVSSTMQVVK